MTCQTPDLTQPTCRICLQNNEDRMSSIFDMDVCNNLHIYEKIEECSGIKIIRHEKIPSLICRNCYAFLTIAYKFRSICRNSTEYFQEFVVCDPNSEHSEVQDVKSQSANCSPTSERAASMTKSLLEVSPSSHTNSEVENENENMELYEEMWLEGEHSKEVTDNSTNLQIVAIEPIKMEHTEGQDDKKTTVKSSNKRQIKKCMNTPSKTLGISSDGAAVICDKKPVKKSNKMKKEKLPHICEVCGNTYDRRYALESHMRRHRQEKPFECEICGQAFHCNFELTRHIRKHTGSRPYECSYCKRTFGDRSTLMKHERIHRNERPYSCSTCGKSFTYSSVLKSHQLTHTGEKPYNCELCGKRFARSHHLRAHLETLQHQNDPLSKVLLKQIKRVEEGERFTGIH